MQNDSTSRPADTRSPRLTPEARRLLWDEFWEWLLSPLPGEGGEAGAPAPPKQRTRPPSPKRLAKWEAHWAAEAETVEGES